METKQVPFEVLISLSTGRLLCDFAKMHEVAEFVVGHPIWTHEFGSKPFAEKVKNIVLNQVPEIANIDVSIITKENWEDWLKEAQKNFKPSYLLSKGSETRTKSPIETLQEMAPGKPIIVVQGGA